MLSLSAREDLAKLFLPENQDSLEKLTLDELNKIEMQILCCDALEKRSCADGELSDNERRYCKYFEFFSIYQTYNAAFKLCELLGVTDIYDIGCGYINQSFLLFDKPNIFYTGIDNVFSLIDYRNVKDETHPNYHYPAVYQNLQDFCGGRIRFVNRSYPFKIQPNPNNIAIAYHSFGYRLPDKSAATAEIREILGSIERDFNRLLITIGVPIPIRNAYEYLPVWKKLMPDFQFYRIEDSYMSSLVFATKIPEDAEKLKSAGWLPTYRNKTYTADGAEIKKEYDFSFDQFYKEFIFNGRFTNY